MQSLYINMVVPGLPFNGNSLDKKSLGGSESAGIYMAKALGKLGHRVTVFCNLEGGQVIDERKVRYIPLDAWNSFARGVSTDVTIIQRAPELFAQPITSRLNVLWCHDMALGRQADNFKGSMWNIDKVVTLSSYMTEKYKSVYGLEEREILRSRNGVDYDLIRSLVQVAGPRNKKKLMYCARPERGLDNLLMNIFPKLLAYDPELTLHIAWYDNPVDHFEAFYRELSRIGDQFGDRVKFLGPLNKRQLYTHYLTAGLYLYPTPSKINEGFCEVSCISAMECMAAGLPMVTSNRGALSETLDPEAGTLIDGDPWSGKYTDDFVDAAIKYLSNDITWQNASKAGIARAKELTWDAVAADWSKTFISTIKENNQDQVRFARHCWRQSDILMLEHMLENEAWGDQEAKKELQGIVDRDFYFIKNKFKEHYEAIGGTHDDRVINWVTSESRYQALKEWLVQRPKKGIILDYGSAHCSYAVNLRSEIGRQWTCVDIDSHGIALGKRYAAERGFEDMDFIEATHDTLKVDPVYDVILIQEVLEHVRDPWDIVNTLEKTAARGATVYITVPYGPWEYTSYDTYPHRGHIWHFDNHDILDMFGNKKDLDISSLGHGASGELGDSLGWWIITYTVDGTPTGTIDLGRKRWLQRPRQTVSVNLMCGPGSEEQLDWTLKSVKHLADEIIIADTGMSSAGLNIAERHAARLVTAPDPKQVGFEVPRNIALEQSKMDWVFWIDSDERLIEQTNVQKYLRENMFHGYAIRQHHFAVDTTFPPDMPVRLFRRRPRNGMTMRFFGMIHEHPELELNKGPGPTVALKDGNIAHTGYLVESIRQKRFMRNYPLLQKDIATYPDRLLQKHFIMRDNILLCRYELAQNGGRVTAQIQKLCRDTVELGRKYFVGSDNYMRIDSLMYYSEALNILGEGFDTAYQLVAARDGAKPNGTTQMRFANKEDFQSEINQRMKEIIDPIVREDY